MNQGDNQEIEYIYQLLCEKAPNLNRLNERYSSCSLTEYLQSIATPNRKQLRHTRYEGDIALKTAFYRACRNYAAPLIGFEKTTEMLRSFDCAFINTANHMNVDTVGAYVQGNVLFGAMMKYLQPDNTVIPLLAAATVPLTTSTYPKGFVCRNQSGELIKIPFFKARYDNHFVANAPALGKENRTKAEKKIVEIGDCYLRETVLSVLHQFYYDEALFQLDTYSQQITQLNYHISGKIMQDHSVQLVYLPMEKIACDMIVEQIAEPDSLLYVMLFNTAARAAVLDTLATDTLLPKTDFFWGIDEKGRKCYLQYQSGKGFFYKDIFRGTVGALYVGEEPEAVRAALLSKRLIPTAYCSIMVFMLSGVMRHAVGGFFQMDYFYTLKQALSAFFQATCGNVPQYIAEQEHFYLCGPSVAGVQIKGAIYSAGLFELLYAGPITPRQLREMLRISLKDSHLLSLQELIFDLLPALRAESAQKAAGLSDIIDDRNLLYSI